MKRILICDPEVPWTPSLKNRLKDFGFNEIIECGNGEAAVKTALDRLPDIAMLSASMPDFDGITAAAEIRKELGIPTIIVTTSYDRVTVKRANAAGVAAFLSKPLREQDLWPAIQLAFAHAEEIEHLKEQVEDLKEIIESRKVIGMAKQTLMTTQGISEPEAFRRIQKLAMDKRKSMRQIAEAILLTK